MTCCNKASDVGGAAVALDGGNTPAYSDTDYARIDLDYLDHTDSAAVVVVVAVVSFETPIPSYWGVLDPCPRPRRNLLD